MIKLYCFGPSFGVHETSPFGLKVDAYMRMAGIEFKAVADSSKLRKAPNGKFPYIDDNGKIIGDSFYILKHLREKYQVNLDSHLTPEQRATSNLVIQSFDESFYWLIVHSRWVKEDTWPLVKQNFFGDMPFPIGSIVSFMARRSVTGNLSNHRVGSHSEEEIMILAVHLLNNLSNLLGDKPYFLGDKPSTLDATAYGFLAQVIMSNHKNSLNSTALTFDNLVAFCSRMHQQYYA